MTIVLGTYNRLALLKKCIGSLLGKMSYDHEIVVIDAGSTDGTLKYLEGFDGKIRLIREGKKIGQVKSINAIFKSLQSVYVCWISDDNIVQPDVLETAVRILDDHQDIGMVGLKVKDVTGPYTMHAYIGGISDAGILNVNQGIVRQDVMREVGYFDEKFPDYGMDVDLTTKILLSGYTVVYTKKVAILHYRNYQKYPGAFGADDRSIRLLASQRIYQQKYPTLCSKYRRERLLLFRSFIAFRMIAFFPIILILSPLFFLLGRIRYAWLIGWIQTTLLSARRRLITNSRDWNNILRGQYISLFDLWYNRHNDYYLVQKMRIVNRTEEL